MAYNLLLDTQFKNNNWKFINCSLQDNYLIATDKIFGIEQELVLPDITKLYFRINYFTNDLNIKQIKIGIQNNTTLDITQKAPKLNKQDSISVIDIMKQEKIKLHIIFESIYNNSKIRIENPILVDLDNLNKSWWLKNILDSTIKYRHGYSYNNIYEHSEVTKDLPDFKSVMIEDAKIGSIITTKNKEMINISAKFNEDAYYLAKLDFEEINRFGAIYFKYKTAQSIKIDNEQLYLIFKANSNNNLELILEANDIIDYKVNLKHILIIDITKLKLLKGDIPYLPFI